MKASERANTDRLSFRQVKMESASKVILVLVVLYVIARTSLFVPTILEASAQPTSLVRSGHDNFSPMKTVEQANQDELAALISLLAMLEAMRSKLYQLPQHTRSKCSRFTGSLNQAVDEIDSLAKLTERHGQALLGLLHEDADASRKLQAINAYESLGTAISFYFECIAQIGKHDTVGELANLLPINDQLSSWLNGTINGL